MALKFKSERELREIEAAVATRPEGIGIRELETMLKKSVPRRSLQYRLRRLVQTGRLTMRGTKRGAKYFWPGSAAKRRGIVRDLTAEGSASAIPLSDAAEEIQEYLAKPAAARRPVGYRRQFLEEYRPNQTAYLSEENRAHLRNIAGTPLSSDSEPAGTFALQILNQLLIDLAFNSSRLEGNTYALLDTKRLIHFGEHMEGEASKDAQMILNHKDAIEFLVRKASVIGFNRSTILNLHALLAHNLLSDPQAVGRLRRIEVGIEKSAFYPLKIPQLVEECFNRMLEIAAEIKDPFEQAFFILVQLPYLQPFDDVNKRVSRLAANIPLMKANLPPLSFVGVSPEIYVQAVLGVYELNQVDLLRDLFIWAYQQSASHYQAIRQSLGDPDPFKLKYRNALRKVVQAVILQRFDRPTAFGYIANWASANIELMEQETFREVAEDEVLGLHEGSFARYQVNLEQFRFWQQIWEGSSAPKAEQIAFPSL